MVPACAGIVILLLPTAGCGERHSRVPVEGVVTLNGEPIKGASITFMPRGKGRPGIAATAADGRFVIREAGMKAGMPPGEYNVAVFLAIWSRGRSVQLPLGSPEEGKPEQTVEVLTDVPKIEKYIVPERYGTPGTSGLSATITGPTKNLAFDLTVKGKP